MTSHQDLIRLLLHREAVIADHDWRDRDPDSHLDALRRVSEDITAWAASHPQDTDAKLRHFLTSASYAKALAHLQQMQ